MKILNDTFTIYNPIQADRFIQEGCTITKIDIHKRTSNIMFVFTVDECFDNSMKKWNNKKIN